MTSERPIKGVGEIAIRVNDLDVMQEFYENVVGLELLLRLPQAAFFRIADGVNGHIQQFAIFDRNSPGVQLGSGEAKLDHIAFGFDLEDYDSEYERLQGLGLNPRTRVHDWVQFRSIYINDPEGNQIEWVCYDPSIEKIPIEEQLARDQA